MLYRNIYPESIVTHRALASVAGGKTSFPEPVVEAIGGIDLIGQAAPAPGGVELGCTNVKSAE